MKTAMTVTATVKHVSSDTLHFFFSSHLLHSRRFVRLSFRWFFVASFRRRPLEMGAHKWSLCACVHLFVCVYFEIPHKSLRRRHECAEPSISKTHGIGMRARLTATHKTHSNFSFRSNFSFGFVFIVLLLFLAESKESKRKYSFDRFAVHLTHSAK